MMTSPWIDSRYHTKPRNVHRHTTSKDDSLQAKRAGALMTAFFFERNMPDGTYTEGSWVYEVKNTETQVIINGFAFDRIN